MLRFSASTLPALLRSLSVAEDIYEPLPAARQSFSGSFIIGRL